VQFWLTDLDVLLSYSKFVSFERAKALPLFIKMSKKTN